MARVDLLLDFGEPVPEPAGDSVASVASVACGDESGRVSGSPHLTVADAGTQVSQRDTGTVKNDDSKVINYRLAEFWTQNPKLWFAQAEGSFELNGETSSRRKFFRVLAVLDSSVVRQVSDLVENVPLYNPYEALKARLLSASKVSDFQKAEKVMSMPPLGERKPSALMAEMLELCPRGWENENWFKFMFLSRLPQHVRVLMRGVPMTDLRLMAEAADEVAGMFVSGSVPGSGAVLNHVSQEQVETLAAMRPVQQQQQQQQQPKKQQQSQPGKPQQPFKKGKTKKDFSGEKSSESKESRLARESAGLCWAHWRFGAKCWKESCSAPCVLAEN